MRKLQVAAAATALCVAGAVTGTSMVGAGAATAVGRGSSLTTTTVVGLKVGANGSVLDLSVLGDRGQATIDAAQKAASNLTILSVASQALGVNQAIGTFASQTPGGQPSTTVGSQDLGAALTGAHLPAVASGSVTPGTLTSAVDSGGARSAITAAVNNLGVAAGVASVGNIASTLGSAAAPDSSTASRNLQVGTVQVLNLVALLQGLGINPDLLSLSSLSALLQSLGVPVSGLPTGSTLNTVVSSLSSTIQSLQATLTATTQQSQVSGALTTVDGILSGATTTLGGLTGVNLAPPPASTSTVADLTSAINANLTSLQTTLVSLLTNGINALANVSLLQADGLTVGITTKAADTVANSAAAINASVGKITVAGLPALPALDLTTAATAVNQAVATVNGQLSTILATVAPNTDLNKLLTVSVLDQSKGVTTDGTYNRATAGITALTVTINPPADLGAIVTSITAPTQSVGGQTVPNVAGLLTANGVPAASLPVVGAPMTALTGAVKVAGGALSQGAVLTVGTVQAASDFALTPAPPAPPADTSSLPRTGGPTALLGALGAILAALALGLRRWQRSARDQA